MNTQTKAPAAIEAWKRDTCKWHLSHQLGDGFSIAREIAPACGRLELFATIHTSGPKSLAPVTDEQARARALQVVDWLNSDPAATITALREALTNLVATARTFRNVPKEDQEWTSIDDTALDAAFAALAQTEGSL